MWNYKTFLGPNPEQSIVYFCKSHNILVMKIWGNHLKVGDTIYYEYDYDIRQSTVKERDTKTFRMPSLIMENGNRLFVNDYYYTEKQEVIDNIVEDLKDRCKSKLEEIDKQQKLLQFSKIVIEDKLKELDKFTD